MDINQANATRTGGLCQFTAMTTSMRPTERDEYDLIHELRHNIKGKARDEYELLHPILRCEEMPTCYRVVFITVPLANVFQEDSRANAPNSDHVHTRKDMRSTATSSAT